MAAKNVPVGLGIQGSVNTVDPVTGDFLVLTRDREFYVFDPDTDTWTNQGYEAPMFTSRYKNSAVHGVVATPIVNYGINLFVSCQQGECSVWIYKHSE